MLAVDNIPHGLDGYRNYKCRCEEVCKPAQAKFMREYRAAAKAKKLAEQAPDNVRPLRRRGRPVKVVAKSPPDEQPVIGDAEQAVIDVVAASSVAPERPDVVVQARILARLMDNPLSMGKDSATSTSRQLSKLMEQLHPAAKTKSKGRLQAVQRLTNRVSR